MSASAEPITVLMPAYNAGRYVAEAIESVLRQTHSAFELVIVDDGSSDDTLAAARRFEPLDPRVRVVAQANSGIANTMNAALAGIRTEWVACMHADDVMLPDRLERQVAFVRENPDVAVVSGLVVMIDDAGREIGRSRSHLTTRDAVRTAVAAGECVAFNHPATMFRRSVVDAVGRYRQAFWPAEDTELWNRVAGAGHLVLVQPEFLLKYRVHGASASMSRSRLMVQKLAWMEKCMEARRTGEAEPRWEQFLASRRWNDRRQELARTLYQGAIRQRSSRQYGRLLPSLAAAALLEPSLVLGRVLPRLLPRTA
jgi:glycosyltransferase involved in cell wall biosynthesis